MTHPLFFADDAQRFLSFREFRSEDMRRLCERRPRRLTVLVVKAEDAGALLSEVPEKLRPSGPPRPLTTQGLRRCIPPGAAVARVACKYASPGQASRSVKSLWSDPERIPRAVVVVEIASDAFDALERWIGPAPVTTGERNTAHGEDALKSGGDDFLARHLEDVVVPRELRDAYAGSSAAVERVRKLAVLASESDCPVLVLGETGTGKEVVARQIHRMSERGSNVFVPVNCSAIPPGLAESELFGHVRGAFTGASSSKTGLWTFASPGTLFLDEIGDLPYEQQAKMLRVLEDGRYRPIGGLAEVESRARVIAATHRDLGAMIKDGAFREDLYYRLTAFEICTPPVREHPDDIPELAQHFWRDVRGSRGSALSDAVLAELRRYTWPGNARGIRAFLIRLSVLARHRAPSVALVRDIAAARDAAPERGGGDS
jgi:hypothetical protein